MNDFGFYQVSMILSFHKRGDVLAFFLPDELLNSDVISNSQSLAVKMLCGLLSHLTAILFANPQLSLCSAPKHYFLHQVRTPDVSLTRGNFLCNSQKFCFSSSAS